jgi:glutamyl-tRNA synthetase
MPGSVSEEARKFALQNAVQFDGKANEKAVVGKVIAAFKGTAVSPKEIMPVVLRVVAEVNGLSLEDQRAELTRLAPELLHREKKEREFVLPALPSAVKGAVVTRFPPEPNGFLHIGHAKAAVIDSEYARMYDGKFILRFDDTNPENEQREFYEAQKEDLRWLNVSWDEEYHTSDHLLIHYKLARQLISQGDAYMCTCVSEVIRDNRFKGMVCSCRSRKDSMALFEGLLDGSVSNGILRLKGDMTSVNTAMRDPTLFRVITSSHPLVGTTYRVWPTYDFAGAVEDSISGVTHPFRTKEYELRDEVYFYILEKLKLRQPHLMEFARLSIEGMPVSKRKIKPLIEQGQVSGFDDIRLPTLRGLRRRGIQPEAIRQFVISQGTSKVESTVDFSQVEAFNRKLLDPKVKRFFFVPDPVKIVVPDAPKKTKKLRFHPTADLLEREVTTGTVFYVPRLDLEKVQPGQIFRLKDLFNVRLESLDKDAKGSFAGEHLIPETLKLQWTTEHHIPLTVFVPGLIFINDTYNPESMTEVQGYAEDAVAREPDGAIVQFERFGFVRLERQGSRLVGQFAHK